MLGFVLLEDGDVVSAVSNFCDVLRSARLTDLTISACAMLGLARCSTRCHRFDRAVILHCGADALLTQVGASWTSPEKEYREGDFIVLREHLGESFDTQFEKARSIPFNEMIKFALTSN